MRVGMNGEDGGLSTFTSSFIRVWGLKRVIIETIHLKKLNYIWTSLQGHNSGKKGELKRKKRQFYFFCFASLKKIWGTLWLGLTDNKLRRFKKTARSR